MEEADNLHAFNPHCDTLNMGPRFGRALRGEIAGRRSAGRCSAARSCAWILRPVGWVTCSVGGTCVDQGFLGFFNSMEVQIRESGELPWLVSVIDEAWDRVQDRGLTLRADAFVFLHMNLRLMVVDPWVGLRGSDADVGEIELMIRNDLARALSLAAERASRAEDEAVSANAVFQAIAELGDELLIRVEGFWGP